MSRMSSTVVARSPNVCMTMVLAATLLGVLPTACGWTLDRGRSAEPCPATPCPSTPCPSTTTGERSDVDDAAAVHETEVTKIDAVPERIIVSQTTYSTYRSWRHRLDEAEPPRLVIDDYLSRIKEMAEQQLPDSKPFIDTKTQTVMLSYESEIDPERPRDRRVYRASIRLLVSDISNGVITINPTTTASVYEIRDGIQWDTNDDEEIGLTSDLQKILDLVERAAQE